MCRYLNLMSPESQEIRGLFRPRDRIATWKGWNRFAHVG